MLKPFPVNRLTASRRRRCFDALRRLRLAVKRFAHLNLRVLSALQSGAVQLTDRGLIRQEVRTISASPPTRRGSGRGLGGQAVGPTTPSAAATA